MRWTSVFHVLLAQNLTSPFPFWKCPHSGLCLTQRCQRPEHALSTTWPSGLDTMQTSASGCWFGLVEDNPGYIRLSQESHTDNSNLPSISLPHFSLWNVCPSWGCEGPGSEENRRGYVLCSPHLLRSYFASQSPLIYMFFFFFCREVERETRTAISCLHLLSGPTPSSSELCSQHSHAKCVTRA